MLVKGYSASENRSWRCGWVKKVERRSSLPNIATACENVLPDYASFFFARRSRPISSPKVAASCDAKAVRAASPSVSTTR